MLGKTYLKLKKEDEARYYLNLARDYQGTTVEDKEVSIFSILSCTKCLVLIKGSQFIHKNYENYKE